MSSAPALARPTPLVWRFGIAAGIVALASAAYLTRETIGTRGQAAFGVVCFLGLAALFSTNLRAVSIKTLLWGIALQFALAMAVLHVEWVQGAFNTVGGGIKALINAADYGAAFVFGPLAQPGGVPDQAAGAAGGGAAVWVTEKAVQPRPFIFAFRALPPIIFVASFFSVMYYLGVLQLLVRLMARVMMYLMGTSGAETLSVSANVFMGQTEAPLIVKPFVPKMTDSELLALMASGMAHISGGMMAVYISYGADPAAILCTCVMACPASLYLAKLMIPETGTPETLGSAPLHVGQQAANVIDAAAGGVKDGLTLALNVAAMLIGFLAFIALFDAILGGIKPLLLRTGISPNDLWWWSDELSLGWILGKLFAPLAFLMGVDAAEAEKVGSLLGIKLAANEHVAYVKLTKSPDFAELSLRAKMLAVFALSGFANFASVGIQIGGIGAIAPERRADLARLGMKALFVGFLTTVLNAAVAGLLMK